MKRWIYVLVPLLVLGSLIVWRLQQNKQKAQAQATMQAARMHAAPEVTVATAKIQNVVQTYEGVGNVESPENVKIASKIAGPIEYLQVQTGDHVTRGQLLVQISKSDLEAQLGQQQAALADAEHRLAQAQITQNPTNVSITTQISQQVAGLRSAQADYNQVRQNYNEQVASAQAAVTDAQGKVSSAQAAVAVAQAAIRSAQANLADATAKYSRYDDLYKQGFVAAQDVDDALAAKNVQESAVDSAKSQLNAANAGLASAKAQLQSAQNSERMVVNTGKANIKDAQAKVDQASAALAYARANTAQRPAYVQNLAALQAEVAAAQAQVRNAQANLAYTTITSPIDGYVTARYMDPGAIATAGAPILNLVILRAVWVTIPIPEEISRNVYPGQKVRVTFDALPGRTFTGQIKEINPSADPTSRQFAARIVLQNPQGTIKPGMFARISMITHIVPNAIVVPREAIQQTANGPAVFVVNADNKVEQRPVTTGAQDPSIIQITSGVQPGDKVVTLSAIPLRSGQTVRIGGAGPGGKSGRQASGGTTQ
ncbi:MAG TPA: efflux RND transporter periplasmic adaptor subunit [Chthonomonadaceae bacterium]|nr:efflux RND transporter periplasmic adaptor subunit [Chthonomonadaceae bacterium]